MRTTSNCSTKNFFYYLDKINLKFEPTKGLTDLLKRIFDIISKTKLKKCSASKRPYRYSLQICYELKIFLFCEGTYPSSSSDQSTYRRSNRIWGAMS